MNYEQKYKAALGWMRKIYPTMQGCEKEDAEHYFPELRESEDEKIYNEIMEFFKMNEKRCIVDNSYTRWIAWLERQKEQEHICDSVKFEEGYKTGYEVGLKEQKPTAEEVLVKAGLKPYKDGNQWCILAGDNIQEGICGFGDTIEDALYEFLMEVLNMQKGQKPAEWSEEDPEVDLDNYVFNKLRELGADLINHKPYSFNRGLNVGKTNAYHDILVRLNARKEE